MDPWLYFLIPAFIIIMLIIMRPLVFWYFKTNERISIEKENNKLLKELLENKPIKSALKIEKSNS